MKHHWAWDALIYHIYPLGLTGAPLQNDFESPAADRLDELQGWLDHLQELGVNTLYVGPLFESTRHGYDTVDYFHVDRRLGNNDRLRRFSDRLHERGMRLILDAVFNHVGRDFWAFYDLRQQQQQSPYVDWFAGLDFSQGNQYGDPFSYEGWNGHKSLVKLNLANPAVREHLLEAVRQWIDRYDIDGLRLDAADVIDLDFLSELAAFSRSLKPDFWLVGEVVHGDYRDWANPDRLDATTNYELYKGLWSSLNDRNYFEVAYALNRQFGEGGLYRDLPLYNFVDNHDVNRVASQLNNPAHLHPLYLMLFTIPGVPTLYYGSELGIAGLRSDRDDSALRPRLYPPALGESRPAILSDIQRLAAIRQQQPALRYGGYRQIYLDHAQFAFARDFEGDTLIVALNADLHAESIRLEGLAGSELVDLLNGEERFPIQGAEAELRLPPTWGRILRVG
ncbi:MAG: alpha-amylase [Chloroflexi bacterium]|nr:alpha-amylase [Chloroflexota bacterium]